MEIARSDARPKRPEPPKDSNHVVQGAPRDWVLVFEKVIGGTTVLVPGAFPRFAFLVVLKHYIPLKALR